MTLEKDNSGTTTVAPAPTHEKSNSQDPLDWRYKSVRHYQSSTPRQKLSALLSSLFTSRRAKSKSLPMGPESESHHNYNGRPWCLGLDHYDYLISKGLKPDDSFLDIGCGALRTGIHVIDYLNAEKYCGIDHHKAALDVAQEYEIPLNRLGDKRPTLLHSANFEIEKTGRTFDWIFAFAVVNHLDDDMFKTALCAFHKSLNPGGKLILSPEPRIPLNEIESSFGFSLVNRETRPCSLIDSDIKWFEFEKTEKP